MAVSSGRPGIHWVISALSLHSRNSERVVTFREHGSWREAHADGSVHQAVLPVRDPSVSALAMQRTSCQWQVSNQVHMLLAVRWSQAVTPITGQLCPSVSALMAEPQPRSLVGPLDPAAQALTTAAAPKRQRERPRPRKQRQGSSAKDQRQSAPKDTPTSAYASAARPCA
jgi:hypothetical protein